MKAIFRVAINRRKLQADFWAEVQRLLVDDFEIDKTKARNGVADYRKRLAALDVGDAVYNAGQYEAAKVIAANIRLKEVLDVPITKFQLPDHGRKCLEKMKIKTLGDLIQCSENKDFLEELTSVISA